MKVLTKNIGYVRPVEGEEYTWFADSDTFGAPPYVVDLLKNGGAGECTCADWVCKRNQARLKGEMNPALYKCKHLKRVEVAWARRELVRRAIEFKKKYGRIYE